MLNDPLAALVEWFTYFPPQDPSLLSSSFSPFYPSSLPSPLLPSLPHFLSISPPSPTGFMSQVTEGSCALERAPCSRSSKYLLCCMFPRQILRILPSTGARVIFYGSSEMAECVCDSRRGKPAGRRWDLPRAISIPFEYISISDFLGLDVVSIIQFWNKARLPRNITVFLMWYSAV